MKKITEIFVLAIASMVALSSCEKQNAINNENTVLKASFEDMTKTALGTEYQVLWSATDEITFFNFDGTANDSKTTTISDNGLTAEFTFDGTVTGDVALFPANSEAEYEEGNISTILPTTQYPVEGGFDPKANIALSKTVDGTAKFYNACTLIGFTIKNDDIKSITLGSDKAFAGDCVIYMDGTPKFSSYEEDPSDLVLEADFVNGKTYYAVIFPQSYGTFELAFERADGKVAKFVNHSLLDLSAKRNCITNIFDMEIPDSKWEANEETDVIVMKGFADGTKTSYITSYTEGASEKGIAVKAKQYIPSSGQVKGNQETPDNQFMIFNTEKFPGAITKIEIVATTDKSNYFRNHLYVATGTESQADVTSVDGLTAWDGDFSWTFNAADGITYFKLLSNEKFTSGSVKDVQIKVTYAK